MSFFDCCLLTDEEMLSLINTSGIEHAESSKNMIPVTKR